MNRATFIDLVRYWIVIAIGIFLAANIVDGISYDSGTALIVVVLLLSIFNIFLKPILLLLTLPFIILTFGLMIWIVNALLFMLAGSLVSGFHVESFSSALLGALVVSLVAIMANMLFGGKKTPPPNKNSDNKPNKDDVIDI